MPYSQLRGTHQKTPTMLGSTTQFLPLSIAYLREIGCNHKPHLPYKERYHKITGKENHPFPRVFVQSFCS